MEKNQTNAANVTMNYLGQAIWGDIWKRTLEKSQTNVTNVIVDENGRKQKKWMKMDEGGWKWIKTD